MKFLVYIPPIGIVAGVEIGRGDLVVSVKRTDSDGDSKVVKYLCKAGLPRPFLDMLADAVGRGPVEAWSSLANKDLNLEVVGSYENQELVVYPSGKKLFDEWFLGYLAPSVKDSEP